MNSGLHMYMNQHGLHEKRNHCFTFLCYIYNSNLYNGNWRYFSFVGVFCPSSPEYSFCANYASSLLLREILLIVTYYAFCTFIWQVYNLEATSLELYYNIRPVRYIWLRRSFFSEKSAQNGLNNENDLLSPQTRSHEVGRLWDT